MALNHAFSSVRTEAKRWKGYVQAGLLSREISKIRVPTLLLQAEGNIAGSANARAVSGPCAVGEPLHARNLHAREPGDPMLARPVDHRAGRSGKAKAAILR